MKTEKQAMREAQALRKVMGDDWAIELWENLGWHWRLQRGRAEIYPREKWDGKRTKTIGYGCTLHIDGRVTTAICKKPKAAFFAALSHLSAHIDRLMTEYGVQVAHEVHPPQRKRR